VAARAKIKVRIRAPPSCTLSLRAGSGLIAKIVLYLWTYDDFILVATLASVAKSRTRLATRSGQNEKDDSSAQAKQLPLS
jgi:hypothetical protein